ncbi:MAG: ornithine carbamoyltransferase [Magnetococcales bacterium]|nr:ornithine carbamoyltransferase [Magnetococcales bacterium]
MPQQGKKKRDFLTLLDLSKEEIHTLLEQTGFQKEMRRRGVLHQPLQGRTLGMIFEKASTRTRVSFEAGMYQLGGQAFFLSARDIQLGRGEPLSDSAIVLSRYLDILLVRTYGHDKVEELAKHSSVPVINGLSDSFHPCQILTDIFTYEENRGSIAGKRVAWIGDGNNMANTWIEAAALLDFNLVLACPEGYEPEAMALLRVGRLLETGKGKVEVVRDPRVAAAGADLVTTDVWTSMGQEAEQQARIKAFSGYMVDEALMALANPQALFMHCLPAHRGEEVTAGVMDSPQSVVWDEAENRMHFQKALLVWLLLGNQNDV